MKSRETLQIVKVWTTPSGSGRAVGWESDRVDIHVQLSRALTPSEQQVLGAMWHDEETATDRHLILRGGSAQDRSDHLIVDGALYDEVVAVYRLLRDHIRDDLPAAADTQDAKALHIRTTVTEQKAEVAADIASEGAG